MELKTEVMQVKMTPAHRAALNEEAAAMGLNPSELARQKLGMPSPQRWAPAMQSALKVILALVAACKTNKDMPVSQLMASLDLEEIDLDLLS